MNKIIILIFVILNTNIISAQIGINTELPTAALTVVTNVVGRNNFLISNSDNRRLFHLRDDGFLGIGTDAPKVKLDLRSPVFSNNIVGIGTTAKPATEVGRGVLRYQNRLEYSDGVAWQPIATSVIEKVFVIARHSSGFTLTQSNVGFGINANMENWTVETQIGTAFNPSTGYFTAPRDGVYSISVTGLAEVQNPNATYTGVQLDIYTSNIDFPIAKSYVSATVPANTSFNVTLVNKIYVYLMKNETAHINIWMSGGALATVLNLSTNPDFNVLTIAEM